MKLSLENLNSDPYLLHPTSRVITALRVRGDKDN